MITAAQLRSTGVRLAARLPARLLGTPPLLYSLSEYKLWFGATGRLFRRYMNERFPVPAPQGEAAGVVISPWVETPTPWYGVMLALGLARRGRRVVLIWDDSGFPEEHLDEQNAAIGQVLAEVGDAFEVVRVTAARPASTQTGDSALVEDLARQNLTWRLRGAGVQTEADAELLRALETSLAASLPLIRSTVTDARLAYLVVPGGVYGTSGLFRADALARGCRVATFDSDQGIGQLCVDGVAAQNGDIARAFDALWGADADTKAAAVEVAQAEFELRTQTRDEYGFQTAPAVGAQTESQGGVLLPMNVEWDTAALGRHAIFADTVDWLTSTIPVLLDAGDGPIVVRQHPSERRSLQRSRLDIATILHDRFGGEPRLRVVTAHEPVSSYDLLRSARLVLPFVSTIAIEAAALGKPVLISGDAYYAPLGFVHSATSRDAYFESLHSALARELPALPDQVERAWICYYLAAVVNRIPTSFTPHPADFWRWISQRPEQLFADAEVADMIAALDDDVPVSLLRHARTSHRPRGGRDSPRSLGV